MDVIVPPRNEHIPDPTSPLPLQAHCTLPVLCHQIPPPASVFPTGNFVAKNVARISASVNPSNLFDGSKHSFWESACSLFPNPVTPGF